MIKVRLLHARVQTEQGLTDFRMDMDSWLHVQRVDTVSRITVERAKQEHLHEDTRAVIRYDCRVHGCRLLYVAEEPEDIVHRVTMELRGQDPDDPFGVGGMGGA